MQSDNQGILLGISEPISLATDEVFDFKEMAIKTVLNTLTKNYTKEGGLLKDLLLG